MAIDEIKSDLQSLIKLYRHLQSLKIGSQSASSEYFDEKAQSFLKDLLDGASERVLGAHSEIMAARLDVSEAAPTTQLENLKGFQLSPPASPHVSINSPELAQNPMCNSDTAGDDEQKTVKPKTIVFSSENSNTKPAKRRRHCKIHPKIHIEQLKSRDTKRYFREKDLNRHYQQRNESSPCNWSENQQQLNLDDPTIANTAHTYDDLASISGNEVGKSKAGSVIDREIERKNEVADSMSNHVASTIKIIDSHILALELAVNPDITEQCMVIKSESSHAQNVPSVINDVQSKSTNGSVCKGMDRVNCVSHIIVGNEVMDRNTMKPTETKSPGNIMKLSENVGKAMCTTNLTNNMEKNQVENPELKEPLKLGWNEDQVAGRSVKAMVQRIESLSRLASQSDQTTTHSCRYVRGIRVPASPSNVATVGPQSEFIVKRSQSSMLNRTHHRYMVPPILYGKEVDQGEVRAQGNKKSMANENKFLQEDTSSSSVASSNWTRQQGSTSSNDIELYSLSDTQSNDYVGSTSYPDSISSGDSDVVFSESTEQPSVGPNEDSESISVGYPRSGNPKKVKKHPGGLRKLKDKLGLIFHHHHHHHHHHHAEATHGRSLWKNAGKILRCKGRRTEKHVGKAVEKDEMSMVHKRHNKNQNGHFNDIVKGVWKHVKNSRSSKVSKGDTERVGSRGKKGAQKLQWWRMLQQQRAAKKTPSKPKVKLGVRNNKPPLRALPMLTSEDGEG